ncbi:hypothetical protein CAEBREN_10954 [Caenorhabditis brenneri]|uniref:RING-type domain-containing protein n=1 Tax=Caenorhabditis brenneri TaxID=135651 RepID=G0MMZ8_CAEBE|nr:hypothetical protein CAEBREN_10954 [Caenorhabditis brenneri]
MPPVTRAQASNDILNRFSKEELLNYLEQAKRVEVQLIPIVRIGEQLRPINEANRFLERHNTIGKLIKVMDKYDKVRCNGRAGIDKLIGEVARLVEKRTLTKEKKVTKQVLKRLDSAMEEDSKPWKSCGECGEEYAVTGMNTPRVLKCGHTMCLQCCKRNLLKKYGVRCPVDDEYTIVKNKLKEKLPKNYAVLDM